MKKLLLVATIGFAGCVSASNGITNYDKKILTQREIRIDKSEVVQQYCQEYVMVVWCDKSKNAVDTVCYELGNDQSRDEAYEYMRQNGRLYNIYNCGSASYGITNSIY